MKKISKGLLFCIFALVAAVSLLSAAPAVMAQPAPQIQAMSEDILTPLRLGYKFMKEGKYDAAQMEFEKVIKRDTYNPYANNNLAAIMERSGKLQEALTYLDSAQKNITQYPYRVSDQVCFTGGICTAVMPEKMPSKDKKATGSDIATVVAENMAKLKNKMGPAPASIPKDVPKMDKNK
jgi:tetratricopeptide (TPR) repeat protein